MRQILYITLLVTVLFASCSSDDIPGDKQDDKNIEISLSVPNFIVNATTSRATRATDAGSTAEQQIDNLFIFLFDNTGANPIRYNVTGATFTDGSWSAAEEKVTLDLTQAEAGTRQVYIVANYNAGMVTDLGNVTTVTGLQAVLHSENNPWSPDIGTPILMSGNATHDFTANRQLDNVPLTRAVAKLELNITLKPERQSTPTIEEGIPGSSGVTVHQYKYKFINFDKNTYVLKPVSKPDDPVSFADWGNWSASGKVTSYTLTGGKITALTLTTYLNERDNPGTTTIELSLPYNSGGPLPPPEFGDETYKLTLPAEIKRNHWYVYDIEI
jgi:hypothetical protein